MNQGFAFDITDTSDTANSNMKVKKRNCGGKNIPKDQYNNKKVEIVDDNFSDTLIIEKFKDLKT